MPAPEKVKQFELIFTSFPHYIERFAAMGVPAQYVPLAFEPAMIERVKSRCGPVPERIPRSVFIGGVGTPSHWVRGMVMLDRVARTVPEADFYGYGYELLGPTTAIRKRYKGPAWGIDMYKLLGQYKIALNRHGEVASKYANNMRMFEAAGMGAMLITEEKNNLRDFFAENECVTYDTGQDAADKVRYYLDHWEEGREIAVRGQARTLAEHTYRHRMKTVSDALLEML